MDKLEYLNQISQSNRPVKPVKKSFVSGGLILKVLVSGIIVTALLICIGMVANAGPARATDLSRQLYVRIESVQKMINTYNPKLKSSQLRSISYSLSGALTGTSAQLSAYLTATYPDSKTPLVPNAETVANEEFSNTNVNNLLYRAQINGTLDRAYATQITLQVSLLMTMTSELIARDKDAALLAILDSFYANLNTISQALDNYSGIGS